ncbi:MAG: efflux RND transporter periplasmic adaptor subunit [Calditrichia bacterium]
MKKRLFSIALTLGILIIGFLISKLMSSQKSEMKRQARPSKAKTENVFTVRLTPFSRQVSATGRVEAYNKVEIYAEVSGVLLDSPRRFQAGQSYTKGEVMLHIDDRVYKNNVLAQKSAFLNRITQLIPDLKLDLPQTAQRWEAYLAEFDLNKPTPEIPQPADNKEKYYLASRGIYDLFYSLKSMEETLAKYTIRAPYNGLVTQATLTPGTLVRVGQKLGEFVDPTLYELTLAVPVAEARFLKTGGNVRVYSEDLKEEFEGKIVRINRAIDTATQTNQIFVHLREKQLQDGMYLAATFNISAEQSLAQIPHSALQNNRFVTVLQNGQPQTVSVEPIFEDGNTVWVNGLEDGSIILVNAGRTEELFPLGSSGSLGGEVARQ